MEIKTNDKKNGFWADFIKNSFDPIELINTSLKVVKTLKDENPKCNNCIEIYNDIEKISNSMSSILPEYLIGVNVQITQKYPQLIENKNYCLYRISVEELREYGVEYHRFTLSCMVKCLEDFAQNSSFHNTFDAEKVVDVISEVGNHVAKAIIKTVIQS